MKHSLDFSGAKTHLGLALENRVNLTDKELFYVEIYMLFLNYCVESLNSFAELSEFYSDIIYGLDEDEIPSISD